MRMEDFEFDVEMQTPDMTPGVSCRLDLDGGYYDQDGKFWEVTRQGITRDDWEPVVSPSTVWWLYHCNSCGGDWWDRGDADPNNCKCCHSGRHAFAVTGISSTEDPEAVMWKGMKLRLSVVDETPRSQILKAVCDVADKPDPCDAAWDSEAMTNYHDGEIRNMVDGFGRSVPAHAMMDLRDEFKKVFRRGWEAREKLAKP